MESKKKILVVVAHPDDEILGCGGTVARMIKEGHEVFTLILGEGITSRDEKRDTKRRKKEIKELNKQVYEANKVIGVKKVFTYDFPDNRFDTVALLDIVKVIEKIKNDIKPNIIFTHYEKDLNIDHQITYKAVITATRPLQNEPVKEIYSFEVLSSTEYSYPLSFSPDVFFDVSRTINLKLEAMKKYKSEIKGSTHPRSPEAVKSNARLQGIKVGLNYAESFKVVRVMR